MKKLFISLIALLFGVLSLYAQITVSASIDSVQLFIGQQTKLSLQATQPQGHILQFPHFSDSVVTNLELVSTLPSDTLQLDNGLLQVTNSYIVTSFDSALVFMPGFEITDGVDTYITNPLSLKIHDMPIDTTQQAITDIKAIYNAPIDWMYIFTIVLYVILAILCIALIIILVRKYLASRKQVVDEEPQPIIDPRKAHEIAYDELLALKEKQLWQSQQFKLYYTELTEILRRYIYNRYTIEAMEQTTDDIISEFRQNKLLRDKKDEIKLLSDVLRLADLVKFAKYQPLPDECSRSFSQVETFVDNTREILNENIEEPQQ
jgi:hypothetical protein